MNKDIENYPGPIRFIGWFMRSHIWFLRRPKYLWYLLSGRVPDEIRYSVERAIVVCGYKWLLISVLGHYALHEFVLHGILDRVFHVDRWIDWILEMIVWLLEIAIKVLRSLL